MGKEDPAPTTQLVPRTFARALCAAAILTVSHPASADNAEAKALNEEGKKLEAAGKVEEACAKLAQSDRLEPRLAVAQARARCEKRAGRRAAALDAWRDVASRAAAAKDAAVIEAAVKEVAALEKSMPKLTIIVDTGTAALEGATISVDGKAIDRATWGKPIPIDAGKHKVEGAATNRKRFAALVDVPATGEASATVPLLEDATLSKTLAVRSPTVVTAVSGAEWHEAFGFVMAGRPLAASSDEGARDTGAAGPDAGGPTSAPQEPDRIPAIGRLYDSSFAVLLGGGAGFYESGLARHGAIKGELTAAEVGATLRYTHKNVGWPVAAWGALIGVAGLPVGEGTGMSTILGGGARIGADYDAARWFSVGPMLGYALTAFSPTDGEGATQHGPEIGVSTHFRTESRKLDANVYAFNRWSGDASALYAGVTAVLARPFLVYGEYRLLRSGTVSAPGQTIEAFAAGLPASARIGIGLEL